MQLWLHTATADTRWIEYDVKISAYDMKGLILGAMLSRIRGGPDCLGCTASLAAYVGFGCYILVSPVSMRIGKLDAATRLCNSLPGGFHTGVCMIPGVVAGCESDSCDGQDHDGNENQGDGLFHCFFLLCLFVLIE